MSSEEGREQPRRGGSREGWSEADRGGLNTRISMGESFLCTFSTWSMEML
jgi:hypothetical protein